jgi:hypothetical protein
MHSAGARVLREDDNEMSREAVLLQWERKVEVADRLDGRGRFARSTAAETAAEQAEAEQAAAEPVPLRPDPEAQEAERAADAQPERAAADLPEQDEAVEDVPRVAGADRRTITITGQPTPRAVTPARRRSSAVLSSQLAQPDRIALWAFLLGLLLVAVAAGTAHA